MIKLIVAIKGSATSGNRGHAGRPGKVGGSAPKSAAAVVGTAATPLWKLPGRVDTQPTKFVDLDKESQEYIKKKWNWDASMGPAEAVFGNDLFYATKSGKVDKRYLRRVADGR